MKRVIIESPFAGDTAANITYARQCVRDSVLRGEGPIASHLLFTQPGILRDDVPSERKLGIEAGLTWCAVADYSVFYTDRGWSAGMLDALHRCINSGALFKVRALDGEPEIPATLCDDMEDLIRRSCESRKAA